MYNVFQCTKETTKNVNFQTSSGYGPQWTAVHGQASNPLRDVIQKLRTSFSSEAVTPAKPPPPPRQWHLKLRSSGNFSAYLTSFSSLIVMHDDKNFINVTFGSVPQNVIGKPKASTPFCVETSFGNESFIKKENFHFLIFKILTF